MKIYDTEGFPNPARVRIALAEKGATDKVEFIHVDVLGGEHRQAEFRAKNPDALVPCLELDDGTYIAQCTAITEYIDGAFPGTALCGTTPKERAVISMMNLRAESGLLSAASDYFHHATPVLGPDIEVYQNADWGLKRREKAFQTMVYLNGVLANNSWIAGDNFSMADITAYAGFLFADFAKIETPAELKHLIAWREKMNQRPSIAG